MKTVQDLGPSEGGSYLNMCENNASLVRLQGGGREGGSSGPHLNMCEKECKTLGLQGVREGVGALLKHV